MRFLNKTNICKANRSIALTTRPFPDLKRRYSARTTAANARPHEPRGNGGAWAFAALRSRSGQIARARETRMRLARSVRYVRLPCYSVAICASWAVRTHWNYVKLAVCETRGGIASREVYFRTQNRINWFQHCFVNLYLFEILINTHFCLNCLSIFNEMTWYLLICKQYNV